MRRPGGRNLRRPPSVPTGRRRPSRTLAALIAALSVLAGAGTLAACGSGQHGAPGPASSPATSGPAAPTAIASADAGAGLHWTACGGSGDQCSTLAVPLDWSRPDGTKITLHLVRRTATGKHRIGSLLINPGGPGASTIAEFDGLVSGLSAQLRSRFDVVGFDPRGVGASAPVVCTDTAGLDAYTALDLAPTTAAGVAALEEGARRFAAACAARSGPLLAHVGTADVARDLDAIRAAVGDPKLTYLGYSYGTFLGAQYAQLFPTRVRALALDGALDPSEPAVAASDAQSDAFQAQLDAFLASCGAGRCGWKVHGDPHGALRALVASVAAHPLPAGGGRQLHAGELFYGIGVTLYDRRYWPLLAAALEGVAAGDGTAMLHLSDTYTDRGAEGYANSVEANLAVNCRDYVWPATPQDFLAAARAASRSAPDFGTANLDLELACAYWPASARATRDPGPFTAPGSPPILVVATTGDPATPYAEGKALAEQLSQGVLLTNVAEQHTAYMYSACVRRHVDAYLTDLTVPPAGARCDDE